MLDMYVCLFEWGLSTFVNIFRGVGGGVEGYVEIQAGFDCTLLLFGGLGVWVGGYFVL